MKSSKVTINDISTALGISSVSVSRALAGHSGVSEEVKNRILKKAKEMGYIRNKRLDQLNILVLHHKPFVEDNSYFSNMIQGVEKSLQNNNIDYSLEFIDSQAQERLSLPNKLSKGFVFDGVLLIGRFHPEYAGFIQQKLNNFVSFTGYSPAYNVDCILFNFNNAGYKLCEYLIQKGHTAIGFLGSTHIFRNKERLLGLTTALEDYQITYNSDYCIDYDTEYPAKILELIHKQNMPSALICENDIRAIELIKLLHAHHINVPEDVSVVGSGNTDISSICTPALTTMDFNLEYSSDAAVSTLIKRILTPNKPFETILVLSDLVERESVKCLKENPIPF